MSKVKLPSKSILINDLERNLLREGIDAFIEEDNTITKDVNSDEEDINTLFYSDDRPERIRLKDIGLISEEADWLTAKFIKFNQVKATSEELLPVIIDILKLNKEDFLDVPYIATYKRHIYIKHLTYEQIYTLFSYEKEWSDLVKLKNTIIKQINALKPYMSDLSPLELEEFQNDYISKAESVIQLNDIQSFIYFLMECNSQDKKLSKMAYHQPKPVMNSILTQLKNNKIDDFVKKFSLPMGQMAKNLLNISNGNEIMLEKPPEPKETPAALSLRFFTKDFDQELKVLTQGCRFAAIEYSSHPFIRRMIFEYYYKHAVISTKPTVKGRELINVDHPSFRIKYIKHKPIMSFLSDYDDLFIDIIDNERKQLITVDIELIDNKEDYNSLMLKLIKGANPNHGTIEMNHWDIMRQESLRMLVQEVLYKTFIDFIRIELMYHSQNSIIEYNRSLFSKLIHTEDYGSSSTIMAFTYDINTSKVHCAVINSKGEVVNVSRYDFISYKLITLQKDEKEKYYSELETLKGLIEEMKPEMILLGANDLICKYIKDQLTTLTGITIQFKELTIAKLYSQCKYVKELSYYEECAYANDENALITIGLARLHRSALETIVSMWEEDDIDNNSCLKIPYHFLGKTINATWLENAYKIEIIKAVNGIGVDFAKPMPKALRMKLLSFICGLGPHNKEGLWELKGKRDLKIILSNKSKILFNCNGFIRFSGAKKVFEMSRVTMDKYSYATMAVRAIIKNKLNDDLTGINAYQDKLSNALMNIDDIMENTITKNISSKIVPFVHKNEEREILLLILNEMLYPFSTTSLTYLHPYTPLTSKEITLLLINDPYFNEGILTTAKITTIDESSSTIKCSLSNTLEATLHSSDISDDDPSPKNLKQTHKEGSLFKARITSINFDTSTVTLSTKPSILSNYKDYLSHIKDKEHYDFTVEEFKSINIRKQHQHYQLNNNSNSEGSKKLIARKIPYEKFRNVNFFQAMDHLATKAIGDFLFRPSHLGEQYLTLTIYNGPNMFHHIDIKQDQTTLQYTLLASTTLEPTVYTYGNLMEIIEDYIRPCNSYYANAKRSKKFISNCDSINELDMRLKREKSKVKDFIHYFFTILKEFPGYILCGYTPKANMVSYDYVKITPSGYEFHMEKFLAFEEVIQYFKQNYGKDEYCDYLRKMRPPIVDYERNCEREFKEIDGLELVEGGIGGSSGNMKGIFCRYCKEEGHIISNCTKKKPRDGNNYGGQRKGKNSNVNGEVFSTNPIEGGWGVSNQNKNQSSGNAWGSDKMDVEESVGWGSSAGVQKKEEASSSGWGNSTNNAPQKPVDTSSSGWGNSTSVQKKEESSTSGWGNSTNNAPQKPADTSSSGWGNSTNNAPQTPADTSSSGWGNSTNNAPQTSSSGWGFSQDNKSGCSNNNNQRGLLTRDNNQQWNNNQKSNSNSSGWGNANSNPSTSEIKSGWESKANKQDSEIKAHVEENPIVEPKVNSDWGTNAEPSKDVVFKMPTGPIKPINERSSNEWGCSSTETKPTSSSNSGWGSSNIEIKPSSSNNSGWGNSTTTETKPASAGSSGWGSSNTVSKPIESSGNSGWGNSKTTTEINPASSDNSGWGNSTTTAKSASSGWGNSSNEIKPVTNSSGWGSSSNETKPASLGNTSNWEGSTSNSTWGASTNANNNSSSAWGSSNNNQSWGGSSSSNNNSNRPSRGDRPKGCYNCGSEDHMSKDCPQPRKERKPLTCYNCQEEGHGARECPNPKKERPNKCFNCQEEGHMSSDCPNPKKERTPLTCYNCQEEGHGSRNCPNPKKERTFGAGNSSGLNKCFNCQEEGHMSSACPNPKKERKPLTCYNCQEEGHGSRNCPNPKKERPNKCFNCQEDGHMAKDCTKPRKERKKSCFNCGSEDHMSFECKEPKKDRGSDSGRGGRGRGRGGFSYSNGRDSGNSTAGSGGYQWGGSSNDGWGSLTNNTATNETKTNDGWGNSSNTSKSNEVNSGGWKTLVSDEKVDVKGNDGWGNSTTVLSENNTTTHANTNSGWGTSTVTNITTITGNNGWGSPSSKDKEKETTKTNNFGWKEPSTTTTTAANIPKPSIDWNTSNTILLSHPPQSEPSTDPWGSTTYNPMTKESSSTIQPQSQTQPQQLEPGEFKPNQ